MNSRNLIMWVIIVLLSVGLFNMFQDPGKISSEKNSLAFSNFLSEVEAGRVVEVQIQGNNISGVLANGKTFSTYSPNYPELVDKLSFKRSKYNSNTTRRQNAITFRNFTFMVSDAFINRSLDIFYETNAGRQRWSNGFWTIKS